MNFVSFQNNQWNTLTFLFLQSVREKWVKSCYLPLTILYELSYRNGFDKRHFLRLQNILYIELIVYPWPLACKNTDLIPVITSSKTFRWREATTRNTSAFAGSYSLSHVNPFLPFTYLTIIFVLLYPQVHNRRSHWKQGAIIWQEFLVLLINTLLTIQWSFLYYCFLCNTYPVSMHIGHCFLPFPFESFFPGQSWSYLALSEQNAIPSMLPSGVSWSGWIFLP